MQFFFFFNDTATTEIYTLSLHDALPIYLCDERGRIRRNAPHDQCCLGLSAQLGTPRPAPTAHVADGHHGARDRKSTRLNSSHSQISYAVFCLKKKKTSHQPSRAMLTPRH